MTTNGYDLPRGMVQTQAPILVPRRIARDHYQMRLKAPDVAGRSKPGQFIHIRCGPPQETNPLLRRPFSLLDVDPKTGTVDFIYKIVGSGTRALTELPTGFKADLLGPLGRPFEIPRGLQVAYLLGGGVGIPPLFLLAKRLLEKGHRVEVFLGARTKDWVICAPQFRRLGVPVRIATDDGTAGYKGSVVGLLGKFLRSANGASKAATLLYVCGPTPMMEAAANLARQRRLSAQVSLEERMGCAMGCCMGCVVEVNSEPVGAHMRFQRVCTEGPVFPSDAILWR